jgi:Opacity protein and related surface antigens
MKKLFVTLFAALLSFGAQAQEKGDLAIGFHAGPTIQQIEFMKVKETSTKISFGAFAQYNFGKHWRTELEANYSPMKDHISDFMAGLNFHYLFSINDNIKIYPLLGYAVFFVHSETYTERTSRGTVTVEGDNDTDSGIQMGAGLQYNLSNNLFLSGEYKYQPGLFGDSHVIMLGVGFKF